MVFIDQIEKAQGQALTTLSDTQKRALELNEKVAEAVKPRIPAVKLPFAHILPTPAEGVKLSFDFAGKLLAANRQFAESVLAPWTDLAPKTAIKPAVKSVLKPVVKSVVKPAVKPVLEPTLKPVVKAARRPRSKTAA